MQVAKSGVVNKNSCKKSFKDIKKNLDPINNLELI